MIKSINIELSILGILIVIFVFLMSYISNAVQCSSSWDESEYKFWSGCMVKTQHGWIPEGNVRVIHWVNEE